MWAYKGEEPAIRAFVFLSPPLVVSDLELHASTFAQAMFIQKPMIPNLSHHLSSLKAQR